MSRWTPPRFLLAPLTKGGNLPFRRLCVDFGAKVTMSEMAYSKQVVRRRPSEMALLRRHESEACFGVQLAVGNPKDGVEAAKIAVERGADFVDINAGCPIHDVIRRGMGSTLLQRPAALARIVEAMVEALDVPVTVKIRAGWKEGEINAPEIARLVEEAGASMITLHGRTREQRYTRAADWDLVAQLVQERSIPVVGNGDVLTWHEAEDRIAQSGCAAVMLARGVLIKPWLFEECASGRTWLPTTEERVEVYLRLVRYAKEHFRDDEKGRKRAMFFLPWHFSFFCRYRPMPEDVFVEKARAYPLMQTRVVDEGELPPAEVVLRDPRPEVHERIAALLWDASDVAGACVALEALAAEVGTPEIDDAGEFAVSTG
ncbi:MAG: tRNA-dihydrouridine synthase family protein [Planctomycetota bacterium]